MKISCQVGLSDIWINKLEFLLGISLSSYWLDKKDAFEIFWELRPIDLKQYVALICGHSGMQPFFYHWLGQLWRTLEIWCLDSTRYWPFLSFSSFPFSYNVSLFSPYFQDTNPFTDWVLYLLALNCQKLVVGVCLSLQLIIFTWWSLTRFWRVGCRYWCQSLYKLIILPHFCWLKILHPFFLDHRMQNAGCSSPVLV